MHVNKAVCTHQQVRLERSEIGSLRQSAKSQALGFGSF
jgi:hypothetical protein